MFIAGVYKAKEARTWEDINTVVHFPANVYIAIRTLIYSPLGCTQLYVLAL
jgi:hypothetical protein